MLLAQSKTGGRRVTMQKKKQQQQPKSEFKRQTLEGSVLSRLLHVPFDSMIEEKQKLMKKTGKNVALNKHSQNLV